MTAFAGGPAVTAMTMLGFPSTPSGTSVWLVLMTPPMTKWQKPMPRAPTISRCGGRSCQ